MLALSDFSSISATIFFATTAPSLIACCAVGGYGLPVFGSIINAQSPSANTPLYLGTSKYLSTTILPLLLSCVHTRLETSDAGATPPDHIIVFVGTSLP